MFDSQGKSIATIHSIQCLQIQKILKVVPLYKYYMKMRSQTNKYIFIECDRFTLQTIVNMYVYKELPNNTINLLKCGVCKNDNKNDNDNHEFYGYNLMDEADLGTGSTFFNKLLNTIELDKKININSENMRYKAICNFLLQVVFIIGHLQSSSLEFCHGDYKPDNVFVKTSDPTILKNFKFTVFGRDIYVKNMGFAVLIADFDRSSISLNSNYTNLKYRLVSPMVYIY
jgi:serine/threonine protein kinase